VRPHGTRVRRLRGISPLDGNDPQRMRRSPPEPRLATRRSPGGERCVVQRRGGPPV